MNKLVATLIASAALITTAFAGEMEGIVKAYDPATKTVTLEDASTVILADGVVADELIAGAKVKLMIDDATKVVTAVQVSK
jgi:hypothetical protein